MQEQQRGFRRDSNLARFENEDLDGNFQIFKVRDELKEDLLRDPRSEFENVVVLVADKCVSTLKVLGVTRAKDLFVLDPALQVLLLVLGESFLQTNVGIAGIGNDLRRSIDTRLEL